MNLRWMVGLGVGLLVAATPGRAQNGRWEPERCGLKPGHFLVTGAVLHLKAGVESRFEDQRQKKFAEAKAALTQALTSGGQQDNPAVWYYLGRHALLTQDPAGADSALARAERLRPECADDIAAKRRAAWVPVYNAAVAAWKAGQLDSAVAMFRQANTLYRREPQGMLYLAALYANSGEADSAIKYFRLGIDAAGTDTAFANEKKLALFNLARTYHRMQRWDEAGAAYKEYLRDHPTDAEATAALAAIYGALGTRDSAEALYRRVLDRADSVPVLDLFQAGVQIYRGAPPAPDTAAVAARCRSEWRGPPATRRTACRDSVTKVVGDHEQATREAYRMAARAFEAVLARNPMYRDGLYNLANVYYQLADTVRMLPVARRLVGVDPMNRTSLRFLAQAHQFGGRGDSTLRYLRMAEDLPLEISVTEVRLGEKDATVSALVTNFHDKPSPPLTLVFELVDGKGGVVATKTLEVRAIGPQSNQQLTVEGQGSGIVAYRYRRQG